MTNLDALKAEVEPYSTTDNAYIKRLIDAGLSENDEYDAANKKIVAKCAIAVLVAFLSLTNEQLGPTSQSYDRQGLESRIRAICDDNGFNADEYLNKPRVRVYRNFY